MTMPVFENLPLYVPRRDARFYHLEDAFDHIEQNQCEGCVFNLDTPYPVTDCTEVDGMALLLEETSPDFRDDGVNILCMKRVPK